MLPLCFSFSSAFSFEKGKYERIPTRLLVKEWRTGIMKTRARGDKVPSKEALRAEMITARKHKELAQHERKCSEPLSEKLESMSVCSSSVSEEKNDMRCNEKQPNPLSNSFGQTEDFTEEGRVDGSFSCKTSTPKSFPSHDVQSENNLSPEQFGSSKNQTFQHDSNPLVIMNMNSNFQQSQETKKTFRLPVFTDCKDINSPHTGSKKRENCRDSLLSKSPGSTSSKLASLASLHLNKSGQSLQSSIPKSLQPRSVGLGPSLPPLKVNSSLSTLGALHLQKNNAQANTFPVLSKPCLGGHQTSQVRSTGEKVSSLDGGSEIPPLSCERSLHSYSGARPIPGSLKNSIEERPYPSPTNTNESSCGNFDDESGENESSMESSDDAIFLVPDTNDFTEMTIDLNVALTKKGEGTTRMTVPMESSEHSVASPLSTLSKMETIPSLKREEWALLASTPMSLLGKSLVHSGGKMNRRRPGLRRIYSSLVVTDFIPFDFCSPSPDDLVREAILNRGLNRGHAQNETDPT